MRSEEILKKTSEGVKESNKILIQELMQDLEEKGISPVIGVDNKVKELVINKSEAKNFESELQKFKLDKTDFCLLEEKDINERAPTTPTKQIDYITVVHKKLGKSKRYSNRSTSWIKDFSLDLKNKFFE